MKVQMKPELDLNFLNDGQGCSVTTATQMQIRIWTTGNLFVVEHTCVKCCSPSVLADFAASNL